MQTDIEQIGIERSLVFPKTIKIYDLANSKRWLSQLFAPLNIQIDFLVTRHNRVEMRLSFLQGALHYQRQDGAKPKLMLSREENEAFEKLALSFAGATR